MRTVTLSVQSPTDAMSEFAKDWRKPSSRPDACISFASPELLWKVLTAKRWNLLKAMCGVGPLSIRGLARRVGRDVKSVHGDVQALLLAGLIDRTDSGGVEFPYDTIKVEFTLQADESAAVM